MLLVCGDGDARLIDVADATHVDGGGGCDRDAGVVGCCC